MFTLRFQFQLFANRSGHEGSCWIEELDRSAARDMRILLTGTTGQVGGALLAVLRDKHEVIAPPRSTLDFTAPQRLGYALDKFAPDLIINPSCLYRRRSR